MLTSLFYQNDWLVIDEDYVWPFLFRQFLSFGISLIFPHLLFEWKLIFMSIAWFQISIDWNGSFWNARWNLLWKRIRFLQMNYSFTRKWKDKLWIYIKNCYLNHRWVKINLVLPDLEILSAIPNKFAQFHHNFNHFFHCYEITYYGFYF